MVFKISCRGGGEAGGARSADSVSSGALGESLSALARQHPGLVHQPSALVGASDSGLVSKRFGSFEVGKLACFAGTACRFGKLGTGRGCSRYMGLLVALSVCGDRLAGCERGE